MVARKIKVVLKDKGGKVVRELSYPEKNAAKLIEFKSGWTLPDDSPYKFEKGVFVEKKSKAAPGQTTNK